MITSLRCRRISVCLPFFPLGDLTLEPSMWLSTYLRCWLIDTRLDGWMDDLDYTEAELESRLDTYFGDRKEEILNRRYQVIK